MKPKAGEFWIVDVDGGVTIGKCCGKIGQLDAWDVIGSKDPVLTRDYAAFRAVRKIDVGALLDQGATPAGTADLAQPAWENLTSIIRPMIESVCSDGNSNAARLAKDIADAILASQPSPADTAETCSTCGFERDQHTDKNGCGEFSAVPRSSAGTALEDRVVEAITEWIGETPPEHALAAAREAIAIVRAQPQPLPVRPDSIYSQFHLDNWLDSDFAAHAAATRKTLAYLIELEASLSLTRPKSER